MTFTPTLIRYQGHLQVASAAMLWGLWALFLRPSGLSGIQNATVALLGMSVFAPFALRRSSLQDKKATGAFVLVGLCDAANAALFFTALTKGSLAVAVVTHYLAPLLVALGAPLLGEPKVPALRLAVPMSLLGLGLSLYQPGAVFSPDAALYGGASALFFAAMVVASRHAAPAYSPLGIASGHSVISALVLLSVFRADALPSAVDAKVALVVAGGWVCGIGGTVLFNRGLRKVGSPTASALTYLEPVSAALVGYFAFAEPLSVRSLLGMALVVGAGAYVAVAPQGFSRAAAAPR